LLYSKCAIKCPEERVVAIIKDAVAIEKEFITDALPVELIGMNRYAPPSLPPSFSPAPFLISLTSSPSSQ